MRKFNKKVILLPLSIIIASLALTSCGSKSGNDNIDSSSTPVATQPKVDTTTEITGDEIAKHSTATDCWAAINGGVYNLSSWVSEHPGGETPILRLCGTDGSGLFNAQHGMMPDPRQVLKMFQIGILKGYKGPAS